MSKSRLAKVLVRYLGRYLALTAIVFGGALLGAGNAVQGYLLKDSGDSAAHQHHHHKSSADAVGGVHDSTPDLAALVAFLDMPAHCMFCIDGIAPEPAALAGDNTQTTDISGSNYVAEAPRATLAPPTPAFHSRAPPALT